MKRTTLIIGIILLVLGGLVATGIITYPDSKALVSVGDASLSVQDSKPVPVVIGYVLLAVGAIATAVSFGLGKR